MTLPANPTGMVLPISICTHAVFAIDEAFDDPGINLVESSPDGFARGLYFMDISSEEFQVRRFSIDATGERCVAVVGDMFSLPVALYPFDPTFFDGMKGRIGFSGIDSWSEGVRIEMVMNIE